MEKGTHHGAAVGVGIMQQGVEIRQQGVSDVQHIPGNRMKFCIPDSRILPLKEKRVLLKSWVGLPEKARSQYNKTRKFLL